MINQHTHSTLLNTEVWVKCERVMILYPQKKNIDQTISYQDYKGGFM